MITLHELYFSYTKKPPYVLENINLTINKGEYISLLGDNGSGKSTLIKLILKLLDPTSGTIQCDAKRIGYVPQRLETLNMDFPITVYEMLDVYRKILKIRDKEIIMDALAQVKMEDYKNKLIGTLSGGQCQKVFIARSLIGEPELLILDEPSTGVDLNSQDEIYALIKEINLKKGASVISVEHNIKAAVANSTKIYHIKNGTVHMCSTQAYVNECLVMGKGDR